jgi:ubiquinone/menaquinone biosynthesis C-methylase UbiE
MSINSIRSVSNDRGIRLMTAAINPFDDPQLVAEYEAWYTGLGHRADQLEKRLLKQLIHEFRMARTVLEIGCGTGHFTRWLADQGLTATGIDMSAAMLAEAKRLGGATFGGGDAMRLPFLDAKFDLSAMITTLEFVADPEKSLTEAARVARYGLLLGVLNRHSMLAIRRRASGTAVWQAAHFFTVTELVRMVQHTSGRRLQSLRWRTTLWPVPCVGSLPLPWGGFIGMSVRLNPT